VCSLCNLDDTKTESNRFPRCCSIRDGDLARSPKKNSAPWP
jgi:hypothetical protein